MDLSVFIRDAVGWFLVANYNTPCQINNQHLGSEAATFQ